MESSLSKVETSWRQVINSSRVKHSQQKIKRNGAHLISRRGEKMHQDEEAKEEGKIMTQSTRQQTRRLRRRARELRKSRLQHEQQQQRQNKLKVVYSGLNSVPVALAITLGALIVQLAGIRANGAKLPDIYWNSSNPM